MADREHDGGAAPHIERRGDVDVLVWPDGGCRPATAEESRLHAENEWYWRELNEATRVTNELRAEKERLWNDKNYLAAEAAMLQKRVQVRERLGEERDTLRRRVAELEKEVEKGIIEAYGPEAARRLLEEREP